MLKHAAKRIKILIYKMNNKRIIIFTDLDGTLLDHCTYSFSEAKEALEYIREREVPIIICSSKTRDEIEGYRKKLLNNEPFISENGGAIFIPEFYKGLKYEYDKVGNGYLVIEISSEYKILEDVLKKIKDNTGIDIKSIAECTVDEVMQITGLSRDEAALSQRREYTLPFIINGGESEASSIRNEILSVGYNYTEGGRFMHLMGANDKGKAVKKLVDIFKENQPDADIISVGIGDSLNDLSMLEVVDSPLLVKKISGDYEERIKVDRLIHADGVGPIGWGKAVMRLFNNN